MQGIEDGNCQKSRAQHSKDGTKGESPDGQTALEDLELKYRTGSRRKAEVLDSTAGSRFTETF